MQHDDSVTFIGVGGATTASLLRRTHVAETFDMVVLMVGGNEIANGMTATSLIRDYEHLASALFNLGVKEVAITSIWPRANRMFNRTATRVAEQMMSKYDRLRTTGLVFWAWDRRQPMRTCDGVHLTRHGYMRAVRTVMSLCCWLLRHR